MLADAAQEISRCRQRLRELEGLKTTIATAYSAYLLQRIEQFAVIVNQCREYIRWSE
jgi:hypothetical protein